MLRRPLTILRSGAIGLFIGILPAVGATMATLSAYYLEQRYSPERARFGRGAPAGLVAAARIAATASATAKGCIRYVPSPGRSTSPARMSRSRPRTSPSPGPVMYDGRNTMVPFVAALVPEVDLEAGSVVVADRPGLVAPFEDEA